MMSMDIAAVGAAPPLPDASCAPTGTPDGETGFAALLDEAAGTDGESLDPSPLTDKGDADDEEALAALAITSLLSLDAPVETPVEAVAVELAATAGAGDATTFLEVTTPDALIDLSAQSEAEQTAPGAEADSDGTAASPIRNDRIRTSAETDVAAESAGSVTGLPVTGESAVTGGEAATVGATRSDAETPARVDAQTAQGTKAARGSTPSRAAHAQAADAIGTSNQATAPTNATTANQATADTAPADGRTDTTPADGRTDTTDSPAPSSTAARLARALERTATSNNDSGAAAAVAATDSGSGQPSSFADASTERDSDSFGAPRHTNGGLTFTIAAPAPFDMRMLTRAADASHVSDLPAVEIPERDVVAQLVQSMRVQFRDGIGEAVVRLKPEHLGAVQLSLKIEHGAITATVQADVASVRHWLESQQDTLRTSLAEQGLRLERFVVEPDGERQAARDHAQPREQRRQQQRQRENAAMSGTDHPVFDVTV